VSTVVFFHAHPDDEAIATGGTMARLADQGHRVILVTATRGELGEVPDGLLADGETLTERRTDELAAACRILGVWRQAFLDFLDSGMAGEESNLRPGSFAAADIDEAAGALARILVEEQADVLVTYDEHGNYGHPDHIQVHVVGMRAAERADTAVVYLATTNRDFFQSMATEVADTDWDPPEGSLEGIAEMGEPAARLTTEVDVTEFLDAKRAAMRAHASQISESSFFLAMTDEMFRTVWGHEWFIRVRPPRPVGTTGFFEDELLLTAEVAVGGGRA
jgi:LmbE family N-acetylglucosaminyl deacetylase